MTLLPRANLRGLVVAKYFPLDDAQGVGVIGSSSTMRTEFGSGAGRVYLYEGERRSG